MTHRSLLSAAPSCRRLSVRPHGRGNASSWTLCLRSRHALTRSPQRPRDTPPATPLPPSPSDPLLTGLERLSRTRAAGQAPDQGHSGEHLRAALHRSRRGVPSVWVQEQQGVRARRACFPPCPRTRRPGARTHLRIRSESESNHFSGSFRCVAGPPTAPPSAPRRAPPAGRTS